MSASNDVVQVSFKFEEKEYLAATRLYFCHSTELVVRLFVLYALFAAFLLLLNVLLDLFFPLWSIAFVVLAPVAWYHGYVIDLPRAYFRGDPKLRDE